MLRRIETSSLASTAPDLSVMDELAKIGQSCGGLYVRSHQLWKRFLGKPLERAVTSSACKQQRGPKEILRFRTPLALRPLAAAGLA